MVGGLCPHAGGLFDACVAEEDDAVAGGVERHRVDVVAVDGADAGEPAGSVEGEDVAVRVDLRCVMTVARYDGHADWYDAAFSESFGASEDAEFLRDQLGRGTADELCLDVACGTGRTAAIVSAAGYRHVAVDISSDQLRIGRQRVTLVAQSDGAQLPIRSDSIAVALGLHFHTDVEDFGAVLAEVGRSLRPGARLIYVGLHPCFIGPFLDRTEEARTPVLVFRAGYGTNAWANRGSGGGTGLWSRVGGHHKTLDTFLNAFTTTFTVRSVTELWASGVVVPRNIGVVAEKT